MKAMMILMMMMMLLVMMAHAEKITTDTLDSSQGFYSYLPSAGLEPPSRPNFQALYDTKDIRTGHSDKSALAGYGVPTPTPHPDHHHDHHGGGGTLKTGYFPPNNRVMPRVSHIEAECRDDVMKLRVAFNDTFAGLIYSAGYTHDHDCMYINGTGANTYEFYIQLNRCGTLGGSDHHKREVKNRNPTKNYMWNTITIQYNPLIEEEWDEHFKITCEYGYDFWKTVTFPFLEVDRKVSRD